MELLELIDLYAEDIIHSALRAIERGIYNGIYDKRFVVVVFADLETESAIGILLELGLNFALPVLIGPQTTDLHFSEPRANS